MHSDIKDHVIAFGTSLIIALAVYFATKTVAGGTAESVGLAVVSGLGVHLIFDRVAYRRKIEAASNNIIQTLRVGTPFEAGYRMFKTEREAASYLNSIMGNATSVWNTRLGAKDSPSSRAFFALAEQFDQQMVEVLKRGGDLRIIYESAGEDEGLAGLKQKADKALETNSVASFELYRVDFSMSPVMQIIIIENAEGLSEALVGWALGEERSFSYNVCLFRDAPIVTFFKGVFEEYTLYRKQT